MLNSPLSPNDISYTDESSLREDYSGKITMYQQNLSAEKIEAINALMQNINFEITPWQPTFSDFDFQANTIDKIKCLLSKHYVKFSEILDLIKMIPEPSENAPNVNIFLCAFDMLAALHPTANTTDIEKHVKALLDKFANDIYFTDSCLQSISRCGYFPFSENTDSLIKNLIKLQKKEQSHYITAEMYDSVIHGWAKTHRKEDIRLKKSNTYTTIYELKQQSSLSIGSTSETEPPHIQQHKRLKRTPLSQS